MEKPSRKKVPTVNLKAFGLAMDPKAPWPRTIECILLSASPGTIRVTGYVNLVFTKDSALFLMHALKDLVDSAPAPTAKSKVSKKAKKKPLKKATPKKRR